MAEAHYLKGQILTGLADFLAQRPNDIQKRNQVIHQAIDEYNRALEIGLTPPESILARFGLGLMLTEVGKLDLAAAEYQTILTSDPNSFEAYFNLADIHLQTDQLDKALKRYHQALKHNPQNPQAHFKIGLILSRKERYKEAIEAYQKALEVMPDYPEPIFNLARIYELNRSPEEAMEYYRRFLQLVASRQGYAEHRSIAQVKLQELMRTDSKRESSGLIEGGP